MPIVFSTFRLNDGVDQFATAVWPVPTRKPLRVENLTFIHQANTLLPARVFSGAWTLPLFTNQGTFDYRRDFTAEWTLPLFTNQATFLSENLFTGNFRLPFFQNSATWLNGGAYSGTWELPLLENQGVFGCFNYTGDFVLPMFGHDGTVISGNAYSGDWSLPFFQVTGVFGNTTYSGSWALPMFEHEATLANGRAFSASWSLPLFRHSGAFGDTRYSGAWELPLFEADGDFLTGNAYSAAWQLPVFTKSGAFGNYQYSGAWTLPMFQMSARFESAITQTYIGWPLNLKNLALTQYDNCAFNSMTRFNGEYLAAGSDGLFALTGTTDNGTAITARIRTGLSELGIENLKRLEEVFCSYRSAGNLTFRVIIDGGYTYNYTLTATGNTGLATNRVKIGKAIKSNAFTFEIENVAGAAFDLNNITLHPVVLSRKIGRPPVVGVFTGRKTLPMFTHTGQF